MIQIVKFILLFIEKEFRFFFLNLGTSILSTNTQFNEIEDAMSNLESTIKNLDAYSRSLESQVKKYEKIYLATRTKSPKKD
jgi:hypothetical protein